MLPDLSLLGHLPCRHPHLLLAYNLDKPHSSAFQDAQQLVLSGNRQHLSISAERRCGHTAG
jgi:hypothetical protein